MQIVQERLLSWDFTCLYSSTQDNFKTILTQNAHKCSKLFGFF